MIRVTIELMSASSEPPKKLASLDICNQSPLGDFGDYTFSYRPLSSDSLHGIVRRHNRSTGFLPLVAAVFKELYGH